MESPIEMALKNAHAAVDALAYSVQAPKFIKTEEFQPQVRQACWVRHRNGAEYRMTYPFNHEEYPLWYPLPKE